MGNKIIFSMDNPTIFIFYRDKPLTVCRLCRSRGFGLAIFYGGGQLW